MRTTRRLTLGLASLAATLWACAVVQLGVAVWTGLLPTPLEPEPRRAAGILIVCLGQAVFLLAVADRLFPHANRPARVAVVGTLAGAALVAAGWLGASIARGGLTW